NPTGFQGGIFDGRYVYFVPSATSAGPHGEVLQYDTASSFHTVSSWKSYDPGWDGVGNDPEGYAGGVFDGRYVYFVPNFNGTSNHGEVLRYDTTGTFTDQNSWMAYDPGVPQTSPWDTSPANLLSSRENLRAVTADVDPGPGQTFNVFALGGGSSGSAVDTVEAFNGTGWSAKPSMATPRYAFGCTVEGGLIYVVGGTTTGGVLLTSVEAFDPTIDVWSATWAPLPTARTGLTCTAVGGLLYAIGGSDGTSYTAAVEAFDPSTPAGVGTWSTMMTHDIPTPRERHAAVALGGKIYVCGGYNGSYLSTLEIYDPASGWTTGLPMPSPRADFAWVAADVDPGAGQTFHLFAIGGTDGSSTLDAVAEYDPATNRWLHQSAMPTPRYGLGCGELGGELFAVGGTDGSSALADVEAYDPDWEGVGSDPAGFQGAVFDGRYITFIPHFRGDSYHGEAMRYDTNGAFDARSSWTAYDTLFPGRGYLGAAFDGRWIYFAPAGSNQVARYDTLGAEGSYKLSYSRTGQDGGFAGVPFGINGAINTDNGTFTVSANRNLPSGTWRHVAMTYDGVWLRVYVDGLLANSVPAAGTIVTTPHELRLGSHEGRAYPAFTGALDEVRVLDRALSGAEILAHAQRRRFVDPEPTAAVSGPEEKR
ncbi:MAG: Kelch repeat-containing protein, partial [Planctomycetota bacterium]